MNDLKNRTDEWKVSPAALEVEYSVDFCRGGKYCVFKGNEIVDGAFDSLKEAREAMNFLISKSNQKMKKPIITMSGP